jgi:hypothetical protein
VDLGHSAVGRSRRSDPCRLLRRARHSARSSACYRARQGPIHLHVCPPAGQGS